MSDSKAWDLSEPSATKEIDWPMEPRDSQYGPGIIEDLYNDAVNVYRASPAFARSSQDVIKGAFLAGIAFQQRRERYLRTKESFERIQQAGISKEQAELNNVVLMKLDRLLSMVEKLGAPAKLPPVTQTGGCPGEFPGAIADSPCQLQAGHAGECGLRKVPPVQPEPETQQKPKCIVCRREQGDRHERQCQFLGKVWDDHCA